MRKLLVAVFALGLVAAMKAPSFAAFTQVGTPSTLTAAASFTAQGSVSYSYQLFNLTGGTTTQIWWNTALITLGQTTWQRADAYMVLTATMTNTTGGIQIYTNNTLGTASPQYTGAGNPAGLVGTSSTTAILPMCWRAVNASTTTLTIVQGPAPYYNLYSSEFGGYANGNGWPCFIYMLDHASTSFAPNAGNGIYQEVWDGTLGMQYAVNTFGQPGTSSIYLYFGASFAGATTPNTYKTSTLTLEAYHE
jgi:hypothetical protein